jgi:hypothetical protein
MSDPKADLGPAHDIYFGVIPVHHVLPLQYWLVGSVKTIDWLGTMRPDTAPYAG